MRNEHVYKIVMTGLMAALSYVIFTFLQIKITLPATLPPSTLETRSAFLALFCWAASTAASGARSA